MVLPGMKDVMKSATLRVGKVGKRIAVILMAMALLFVAVLGFNVAGLRSRQMDVAPVVAISIDETLALERFSTAIRLPTISYGNRARNDAAAFDDFQSLLETNYPAVAVNLKRQMGEVFGDAENDSLLYHWPGSGADRSDAVLLMAHYDVVPIEPSTIDQWTHPPFGGVIEEGFVWGRGTLDDKCAAIALMEACEQLVNAGFQPRRDIYLAFGHDEEVGGRFGNQPIADWMRRQGIRLEFVLDEGGGIFRGVPGLDQPAALIGIAEKGFLNVTMTAQPVESGHASIPPNETAIGLLAAAINRLHQHPFPARLEGGVSRMLDYLGPEMSFANRIAVANRWVFGSLIERRFSATPAGNAALRTTLVPTLIQGGFTRNALPSTATVNLHVRILPGESVESSLQFLNAVVADDRILLSVAQTNDRVSSNASAFREPSRVSSDQTDAFRWLHQTIKEVYPHVVVAPFFVVAGTDSAHYDDPGLARDVYRFTPWDLDQEGLTRIHGINERIAAPDFFNMIRFYERLIRNVASGDQG